MPEIVGDPILVWFPALKVKSLSRHCCWKDTVRDQGSCLSGHGREVFIFCQPASCDINLLVATGEQTYLALVPV